MSKTLTAAQKTALQTLAAAGGEITVTGKGNKRFPGTDAGSVRELVRSGLIHLTEAAEWKRWRLTDAGRAV